MSHCPRCSIDVPRNAQFCPGCGFNLALATAETGSLDILGVGEPSGVADLPLDVSALVVTSGPNAGERFLLMGPAGDVVTVGRAAGTDVFLDDVTVSRHHGEFCRTMDGWTYKDGGSLNGTYVNGRRVDAADLSDNDTVVIGKFHFVFRVGGSQ